MHLIQSSIKWDIAPQSSHCRIRIKHHLLYSDDSFLCVFVHRYLEHPKSISIHDLIFHLRILSNIGISSFNSGYNWGHWQWFWNIILVRPWKIQNENKIQNKYLVQLISKNTTTILGDFHEFFVIRKRLMPYGTTDNFCLVSCYFAMVSGEVVNQ